ncbi:MlaD family protein [Frankia sp. CiP1_Cm_nod1]|uniref:MlaD family protein n=1 Tax=Frankia sp. CiP1_Cm_nod1 TaxID=2897160 RepID=UPI002023FC30
MAAITRRPRVTPLRLGVLFIIVSLLAGLALFNKNRILVTLRSGDSLDISFAADNRLAPYRSQVKVAFVPVGVVTGVRETDNGDARVTVKVDGDIRAKLGTEPSAVIRPTTLLGGNYFIDLVPGGRPGTFTGSIPVERTKLPVELDKVAAALQPSALEGLRKSTSSLDKTLGNGGREAVDQLVAHAPDTLDPAAAVAGAALGGNPDTDLPQLVTSLEATARELIDKQGQLDAIVTDLGTTTSVLSRRTSDIATAVSRLPSTLDATDAGLARLKTTLEKLRDTSGPAQPVVRRLDTVLATADPVLAEARPVVNQLRGVLVDARPLVQDLVPAGRQATTALDDLSGPVLDRIDGPVKQFVLAPYHGTGPYAAASSDKPIYQELAYMATTLARTSVLSDRNGALIALQPGVGAGSVGGLPISLEQLLVGLSNQSGAALQKGAQPR